MDSIVWTGNNLHEVEAFAKRSNFGFTVGSPHGRYRWYHRWFERLSYPRYDSSILEIYPERDIKNKSLLEQFLNSHTDDDLHNLYTNVRIARVIDVGPTETLRQLVLAVIDERNREYTPWHWTTAKPGDRIFADGTVERKSDD